MTTTTATKTAQWRGQSGQTYVYSVYELDTNWNDVPGNYIFAAATIGGWVAKYIGQTRSFKDRLPGHEAQACAVRNGATHIHAHVNSAGEAARKREEADLIVKHRPPCNDQGK